MEFGGWGQGFRTGSKKTVVNLDWLTIPQVVEFGDYTPSREGPRAGFGIGNFARF